MPARKSPLARRARGETTPPLERFTIRRSRHAGCHPASGQRAGGLDSCFRRKDGRLHSSVNCPSAKHPAGARGSRLLKECGLPARKRPRWPLSQAARGASGPRRGAAGPAPGGSRHNMHHTSLRRAGFQPAWRPGWPPPSAGCHPASSGRRAGGLSPKIVFGIFNRHGMDGALAHPGSAQLWNDILQDVRIVPVRAGRNELFPGCARTAHHAVHGIV